MYNPKSLKAEEFIYYPEAVESAAFARANAENGMLISGAIDKARGRKGLSHREAALLLACDIPSLNDEIFDLAASIKREFYGNRAVLFAPLYLSNYCVNGCLYCPYHYGNARITRKKLSQADIAAEVTALQDMGHKRLALEAGEDPVNNPIEYILASSTPIYSATLANGAIRRVNVNIAATTGENYKKLKAAGIGTYILFQETYNPKEYKRLHPSGPKSDYAYHTEAMDRAFAAGLDDMGLGALFGLNNYMEEFSALMMHAEHLEAIHGVGPHTISVPRVRAAEGVDPARFPHALTDKEFLKLVAVIRVCAPYTGIIVSTRESEDCRADALKCGVSQISGGSRTSVGGYLHAESIDRSTSQFEVNDTRPLDKVVRWLMDNGHIPSFCTACYREGRTGDRFMALCKSGNIGNICLPNALMTLKEYLCDYADADTKVCGEALIARELSKVSNEQVRKIAAANIAAIENNKRDFRF